MLLFLFCALLFACDARGLKGQSAQNFATLKQFFGYFLTPSDMVVIGDNIRARTTNHLMFTLFNPDVAFRLDPLGDYRGIFKVLAFQVGQHYTRQAYSNQVVFRNFAALDDFRLCGEAIHFYTLYKQPPSTLPPPEDQEIRDAYNTTQIGCWTFDEHNRISSFDGTERNLGWIVGDVFENRTEYEDYTCQLAAGFCPSTYASYSACRTFLSTLEYGDWNQLQRNSVLCRFNQASNLLVDADAERCNSIGPSPAKYCYDRDARTEFELSPYNDASRENAVLGSIPEASLEFLENEEKRAITKKRKL